MACWRGVGRTTVHPEQDGVSPYWSLYDTDFAGGGWAVAPNDSSSALPAFIVNKETGRVLVVKGGRPPGKKLCTIYGVLGIFTFPMSSMFVVITHREHAGTLLGQDIWHVTDSLALPCGARPLNHESVSAQADAHRLLHELLQEKGLYFSYTYDLSLSLQAQSSRGIHVRHETPSASVLWNRANTRFLFNHAVMAPLLSREELRPYCVPIIYGFVGAMQTMVNGRPTSISLVARRDCRRLGTRLHCRGVDAAGAVANFVETEQLVELDAEHYLSSYVAVRGSVPLFWEQNPSALWRNPAIRVTDAARADHAAAFAAHLRDVAATYEGPVVCVDLLCRTHAQRPGGEGYLARMFEEHAAALREADNRVEYLGWDLRNSVTPLDYSRLAELQQELEWRLMGQAFFAVRDAEAGAPPLARQAGVLRINCKDCLDRTGLVMGEVALRMVESQLRASGAFARDEAFAEVVPAAFRRDFHALWAAHGDMISLQYAGTRAMKRDVGFGAGDRRSLAGLLGDGVTALARWHSALLLDHYRNGALALLVSGALQQRRGSPPRSRSGTPPPLPAKPRRKGSSGSLSGAAGAEGGEEAAPSGQASAARSSKQAWAETLPEAPAEEAEVATIEAAAAASAAATAAAAAAAESQKQAEAASDAALEAAAAAAAAAARALDAPSDDAAARAEMEAAAE